MTLTETETVDPLLALTHMTASGCAPCDLANQSAVVAAPEVAPAQPATAASPASTVVGWAGVIGVEGELTGDGRLIEPNSLRWENLPLPLRYVASDSGAHDGAVVVGQITSISRGSGGAILGEGTLDTSSPAGLEAIRQVGEGLTTGVSMDLDDVSFEVRIAAELMDGDGGGFLGMLMASEDEDDAPVDAESEPEQEVDADGRVTVMEIHSDDEVRVTTDGRIRAATIVAIPAFATAAIHLTETTAEALAFPPSPADAPADETVAALPGLMPDGETPCSCTEGEEGYDPECVCEEAPADEDENSLIAAAIPLQPLAAWFANPGLSGPQGIHVTDDGRIFGHLATWNTCHISHTHGGCVTPPRSASGYGYFHTGAVVLSNGAEIPCGRITLDTRHAGPTLSANAASAHYENTGAVVADVVAGEDRHGIWVAGALRPGVTPTQVRAIRAAPLSGDWRRIGGAMEMVAALSVNVAGFPVPRPSGLVAGGALRSLVAAGMLAPRRVRRPGTPGALSLDDLRWLKRLADRERREAQLAAVGALPSADELARRVRGTSLAMRIRHPKES